MIVIGRIIPVSFIINDFPYRVENTEGGETWVEDFKSRFFFKKKRGSVRNGCNIRNGKLSKNTSM